MEKIGEIFEVTPEEAGERLDRFVAARCEEISRSRAQELIEAGLVHVDGRESKASHKVRRGEMVRAEVRPRPAPAAEPEEIPLDVIYEDQDVIVIDKPAGMTVHAGAGVASGTLVNALLGRGQQLSRGGDVLRPGIVHRLDKETSGAIVAAKNDAAHAKLSEAFRSRAVKKTYLALVHGEIKESRGSIEWPIGRDPKRRTRMAAQTRAWHGTPLTDARAARTDWKVLARIGPATLVEVQLHTGRTHQIRVHFSALKHPVVGDTLYGAPAQMRVRRTTLPAPGRNFLHAAKLGFAHPRTGEWIGLKAALPGELKEYLAKLASAAGDEPGRIDAVLKGYL